LLRHSDDDLRAVVDDLKRLGVQKVAPTHCSGLSNTLKSDSAVRSFCSRENRSIEIRKRHELRVSFGSCVKQGSYPVNLQRYECFD